MFSEDEVHLHFVVFNSPLSWKLCKVICLVLAPSAGQSYVLCKFYTEKENQDTTAETDLGFSPEKFIAIFQFNASNSMTVFQLCNHIFMLVLSFPSKL